MAARRCSGCGINFPLNVMKCRTCGEDCWISHRSKPDEDQLDTPKQDSMNEGLFEPSIAEPPPALQQSRITHFSGQCWISDFALEDGGYTGILREGTVIRFYPTAGNLEEHAIWFELAGRAKHKRLGEMAGWWILRLETPAEMFADLPVTEGTDDDGRPA